VVWQLRPAHLLSKSLERETGWACFLVPQWLLPKPERCSPGTLPAYLGSLLDFQQGQVPLVPSECPLSPSGTPLCLCLPICIDSLFFPTGLPTLPSRCPCYHRLTVTCGERIEFGFDSPAEYERCSDILLSAPHKPRVRPTFENIPRRSLPRRLRG
jgi:hypothetical protein